MAISGFKNLRMALSYPESIPKKPQPKKPQPKKKGLPLRIEDEKFVSNSRPCGQGLEVWHDENFNYCFRPIPRKPFRFVNQEYQAMVF